MSTTTDSPAAWISGRRDHLGLTKRDLARLAGVSVSTISRIENRQQQACRRTLEKLLDVLGRLPATTVGLTRLVDLSEAWFEDATGMQHPDWVRLRAFADQLELRPYLTAQAIAPEPPRSRSALIETLLAGIAEKVADDAGIARPRWAGTRPPLQEEWSATVRPSKRAEAAATAPVQLLQRGLLIPAAAIWRERPPGSLPGPRATA